MGVLVQFPEQWPSTFLRLSVEEKMSKGKSLRVSIASMQEVYQNSVGMCSKIMNQVNHPQEKVPLLLTIIQQYNNYLGEFHQRFKHERQTTIHEKQLLPKLNFLKMYLFGFQLGFYTTELMKLSCMNPPRAQRTKFHASIPLHQGLLLQNQMLGMYSQNLAFYKYDLLGQYPDNMEEIKENYREMTLKIHPLFEHTLLGSYCKGVNLFDLYFRYAESLYGEKIYKTAITSYQRCVEESSVVNGKFYSTPDELWQLSVMTSMCLLRLGFLHAKKLTEKPVSIETLQEDSSLKYWFDKAKSELPKETYEEITNDPANEIPGYHYLLYCELKRELNKLQE